MKVASNHQRSTNEMKVDQNTLKEIASLAMSFQRDFEVFELDCYYNDDHIVGPNSRWLDVSGSKVGWDNQIIRAVGKVYFRKIDPLMRSEWKRNEANYFVLRVWSADNIKYDIGFDEGQELRRHRELLDELGHDQYEELYGRSAEKNCETYEKNENQNIENSTTTMTEEYSAQDLYSHLYHTVTADLPANWKSVSISFSVSFDGEYKQMAADYLFEDKNGKSHIFEPAETYGPLNAMDKLRELSEEEPWQNATFYLYPDGQIGFKAGSDA